MFGVIFGGHRASGIGHVSDRNWLGADAAWAGTRHGANRGVGGFRETTN